MRPSALIRGTFAHLRAPAAVCVCAQGRNGLVAWYDAPMTAAAPPEIKCSFCGKSQKDVKKLVAGPTVYVCDECVGLSRR